MRVSVQIEFDKTLDLVTDKTCVIVGRSPKCDLVIPHEAISRQHCQIEFLKNKFYITDLGSSNGITIDGRKIPPNTKVAINPTSQLTLGKLDCEISQSIPDETSPKIISSTVADSGDFTATMRLSRIELNRPSITLELEKKKSVQKTTRARNPIVHKTKNIEETKPKKSGNSNLFLILIGLALLAVAWYLAPEQL